MENQLYKFINKIISHFTNIVESSYTISSDLIELDLRCNEVWEDFELQALKYICRSESENFGNVLDSANFDKSFLISSIPSQKKLELNGLKMNNEIIDEVKCVTFLEQIRNSIDEDRMFQNCEVKTDITHNKMSLILKKGEAFNFQEIDYIVKLIDENELFSFNDLYNCGWCSSSKVTEASPGNLEFSWLKIGEKCNCATCSLRFEKNE